MLVLNWLIVSKELKNSVNQYCLTFRIDSFFFWLPFYLRKKFDWEEADADLLSTFYDVGGIFGGIFGGLLSV